MLRNIKGISIVILFFVMLAFPKAVFSGASEGLLLWFQIILPTLFPFLLISNLLVGTGNIFYISSLFGKILSTLFHVSKNGSFAVITGFLCGYPMGAKVTADLVSSGKISKEEGKYLLSFCNNTSPIFIMNFLVWKTLRNETLLFPTLGILILSPVIVSLFTRKFYLKKAGGHFLSSPDFHPLNRKNLSFQEIDDYIMDAFETLLKVGGYIILFSVLLTIGLQLTFFTPVLPFLEITNGIVLVGNLSLPLIVQYPLLLGLTAFGGLCSVAQTQCMVQKAKLPIFPYIIEKLAAAGTASILGFLYLYLTY